MSKGTELYNKAKKIIPGGTMLLSKRPEMFLPDYWPSYYQKAKGAYIWDLDDNKYIDVSISGIGACPFGYADDDINLAIIDAVKNGVMTTLNCYEEVELAELLTSIHSWADMVRYTRSGGEAMNVAIRIARAKTKKSKVLFCGYHGWSDWYLAANLDGDDALGSTGIHLAGLDPSGVPRQLAGTSSAFKHHSTEELKKLITKNKDDIACIVIEVQRHTKPNVNILQEIKQIAKDAGAVLIFDEITSGFRMTCGGIHLLYDINPDIAVFAKALGSGHPIGAVIGTEDVMQSAQQTFISSTYWTERLGSVAGLATIKKFKEIKAEEKLINAGRKIQAIWKNEAEKCGLNITLDHPDCPPLSFLAFNYPNARAIKTLLCQLMLERGFLDNASFYATTAHTDEIIKEYEKAVGDVFPILIKAINENKVETSLNGPVGHSSFERLL